MRTGLAAGWVYAVASFAIPPTVVAVAAGSLPAHEAWQ